MNEDDEVTVVLSTEDRARLVADPKAFLIERIDRLIQHEECQDEQTQTFLAELRKEVEQL